VNLAIGYLAMITRRLLSKALKLLRKSQMIGGD